MKYLTEHFTWEIKRKLKFQTEKSWTIQTHVYIIGSAGRTILIYHVKELVTIPNSGVTNKKIINFFKINLQI